MIIGVEANIGAGKTTLITNLKQVLLQKYGIESIAVPEPIAKWTSTPAGNLLSLFGDAKKEYSFTAQSLIMSTMAYQRTNLPPAPVILLERSLESSTQVFQKALKNDGYLTPLQDYVLTEMYQAMSPLSPPLNGIIYLKIDPTTAHLRTQSRAKEGDKKITLDYLRTLDTYCIEMIKASDKDILTLDATEDPEVLSEKAGKWIEHKMFSGDVINWYIFHFSWMILCLFCGIYL